ncbi:MAG: glycosyltransferase, partial [Saprospiraceae bacterium]
VFSAYISLKNGKVPVISLRGTMTSFSFTHSNKIIKQTFHKWLGEKLLRKCILHVTSDEERTKLQQFVSSSRIYTIPNLLDLPNSLTAKHKDEPYLKLIFIGRIHPVKNLEMLFEALRAINTFSYQLQVVGEGEVSYMNNLKSKTADLPSIHWLGNIDGDEKFELLSNADLLALPSHIENFGNVVIEALSQGTPVVVSGNVGAKEYILKHNLGWVVNVNEQDWQNTLIKIANDKASLRDMRMRAIECIAQDFDKTTQIEAYQRMYERSSQK